MMKIALIESCQIASNHISEGDTVLLYANNDLLVQMMELTLEDIKYSLIIVLKDG